MALAATLIFLECADNLDEWDDPVLLALYCEDDLTDGSLKDPLSMA